ncbi:uncharacterized protein ACN427_002584 [Glossina fuscipes fuscipes]
MGTRKTNSPPVEYNFLIFLRIAIGCFAKQILRPFTCTYSISVIDEIRHSQAKTSKHVAV